MGQQSPRLLQLLIVFPGTDSYHLVLLPCASILPVLVSIPLLLFVSCWTEARVVRNTARISYCSQLSMSKWFLRLPVHFILQCCHALCCPVLCRAASCPGRASACFMYHCDLSSVCSCVPPCLLWSVCLLFEVFDLPRWFMFLLLVATPLLQIVHTLTCCTHIFLHTARA